MSDDSDALKDTLRAVGLRATTARIEVLRCLRAARGPLTHAEVCDALASRGYDRATLYRNLIDLTEVGLAVRTDLGDHLWRFERAADTAAHEPAHHAHFVCSECGDVSCLPDDTVDVRASKGVPQAVKRREVEIQIRGVCNACE